MKARNVEYVFKMSSNHYKNWFSPANVRVVLSQFIKNVSLNGSVGRFLLNPIGSWLK